MNKFLTGTIAAIAVAVAVPALAADMAPRYSKAPMARSRRRLQLDRLLHRRQRRRRLGPDRADPDRQGWRSGDHPEQRFRHQRAVRRHRRRPDRLRLPVRRRLGGRHPGHGRLRQPPQLACCPDGVPGLPGRLVHLEQPRQLHGHRHRPHRLPVRSAGSGLRQGRRRLGRIRTTTSSAPFRSPSCPKAPTTSIASAGPSAAASNGCSLPAGRCSANTTTWTSDARTSASSLAPALSALRISSRPV